MGELAGEIMEYVESNGQAFFVDKTDDWLRGQLGITGSYEGHSRRYLVQQLRGRTAGGSDVSMICVYHFTFSS